MKITRYLLVLIALFALVMGAQAQQPIARALLSAPVVTVTNANASSNLTSTIIYVPDIGKGGLNLSATAWASNSSSGTYTVTFVGAYSTNRGGWLDTPTLSLVGSFNGTTPKATGTNIADTNLYGFRYLKATSVTATITNATLTLSNVWATGVFGSGTGLPK